MSRLPLLPAKKVIKALERMGFKKVRQSGSHVHLWNEETNALVTVPEHNELARGTLNSIIKQSKIDRDTFLSNIK